MELFYPLDATCRHIRARRCMACVMWTSHNKIVHCLPFFDTLASTEGFFVEDSSEHLELYNPGAGAQCEGESVSCITSRQCVEFLKWRCHSRFTKTTAN